MEVIKDISHGGLVTKPGQFSYLCTHLCVTSMSVQGAITWFKMVPVKQLTVKWKHDYSFGGSHFIADSPKWFHPTHKVLIAKSFWHHCYFSFKCPCGVDTNNPDQNVYKKAEKKNTSIVGEDLNKNSSPFLIIVGHNVQGVRTWKMQTLGLSLLCSSQGVRLTDFDVGLACWTGTAWWLWWWGLWRWFY